MWDRILAALAEEDWIGETAQIDSSYVGSKRNMGEQPRFTLQNQALRVWFVPQPIRRWGTRGIERPAVYRMAYVVVMPSPGGGPGGFWDTPGPNLRFQSGGHPAG